MGFKIGEVDIYTQTINHQYQIDRILRLLDIIIEKANIEISPEDFKKINEAALKAVQETYPNSGIKFSNEERANERLI